MKKYLIATVATLALLTSAKADDKALGFAGFEAYHEHCGAKLSDIELATLVEAEPSETEMKPARELAAAAIKVLGKDKFCRDIKPSVDVALIKVRKALKEAGLQ